MSDTPSIDERDVEVVARAIYGEEGDDWSAFPEYGKELFRKEARAAILALDLSRRERGMVTVPSEIAARGLCVKDDAPGWNWPAYLGDAWRLAAEGGTE